MPAHQPFTQLCQRLARPRTHGRADLHLHTTCSDGVYRPHELVDLARRSGLCAIAVTDHDTTAGVEAARAAAPPGLEVCAGAEITTEFRGRELHLLGLFLRLDDAPLEQALAGLREARAARFRAMAARLQDLGVELPETQAAGGAEFALGRRHLAEMLVQRRKVGNVREAFSRYLGDFGPVALPNVRLPVCEAIRLVRGAGGVTAWAHPGEACTAEALLELRGLGLHAVEVDYPSCTAARSRTLRALAASLGLAVSGGSDCHGPGEPRRTPGARGLNFEEFAQLKALAQN